MCASAKYDLNEVVPKYLEACDSPQNQHNRRFWSNADDPWLIERWRGISATKTGAFTLALDIAGYAGVLDIDTAAYYGQAEAQLYEQMRYQRWEFDNFRDNRFFQKTAFVSFGACYAASLFGAQVRFPTGQAPWIDAQAPCIAERSDLDRIPPVELAASGLGPRAHAFYERMCALTAGTGLKVMYPTAIRGPFSIATQLRETSNLLIDMVEDPPFVHALMRRITDGLKRHAQLRAEFTGEPIQPAKLFNDEIGTPMISCRHYEEFILPYELELAAFHGRVHYWHSCGVTDEFYEAVQTIPHLEMMHIGPWSSVPRAAEVFAGTDIALDICVNATADVYDRAPAEMREKLRAVKAACDGRVKYSVRADGFQIVRSVEQDMAKIRGWNQAAADVLGA